MQTEPYSAPHPFRAPPTPCPACEGEGFVVEDSGYTDLDGAPCGWKLSCQHCSGSGLDPLDGFDADDSHAQEHEVEPFTQDEIEAAFLNLFAVFTTPRRTRVAR